MCRRAVVEKSGCVVVVSLSWVDAAGGQMQRGASLRRKGFSRSLGRVFEEPCCVGVLPGSWERASQVSVECESQGEEELEKSSSRVVVELPSGVFELCLAGVACCCRGGEGRSPLKWV
jgi:hypothetical protein